LPAEHRQAEHRQAEHRQAEHRQAEYGKRLPISPDNGPAHYRTGIRL